MWAYRGVIGAPNSRLDRRRPTMAENYRFIPGANHASSSSVLDETVSPS
jgi:hypothetical protein